MSAPVQCIYVTITARAAGMLKTCPFLERFSLLALLEITGHNPSAVALSGFSITLPSHM